MRITVTLDPEVAALVDRHVRDERTPLADLVNDALRRALGPTHHQFSTPTFAMGPARVPNLDRILGVAAAMEDQEIARRMDLPP